MRALIALALLPGCLLYTGNPDDEDVPVTDAGFPWWVDAERVPDAEQIGQCDIPLPCPAALANRVTVCGRVRDVSTNANVTTDPVWATCDPGDPNATGVCRLQIRFFDALDLAGNPSGATPLTPQNFRLDDCGRFVAENIPRPSLGFLGITVDDTAAQPDDHRTTATAFPVTSGMVRMREVLYAYRRTTDDTWSTQAVLNGMTFADRGAILALYLAGGDPQPGVTITENGQAQPADDYYFGDVVPQLRTSVNPSLTATGANGAALLLNSSLVEHSGTNPPTGCSWPSQLAASTPGLLWVVRMMAETPSGTPCL